jgi:hypothetical protein
MRVCPSEVHPIRGLRTNSGSHTLAVLRETIFFQIITLSERKEEKCEIALNQLDLLGM